jgi:hypothetical protein
LLYSLIAKIRRSNLMMNKTRIAALVGGALLICATESQAAISWTYGGSFNPASPGNTVTSTAGGVTATASAWANTNDGTPDPSAGNPSAASLGSPSGITAANYTLETAYLGVYSGGLGVNNRDGINATAANGDLGDLASTAPEHAIDNNQRYDSVLFSFTNAVNLTAMTTGYVSTDSDFTVWYYAGLGTPTLTGNTYGALGAGWHLLGSYNGTSSQVQTTTFANSNFSSYWLIGAYNDLVAPNSALDAGNDYFKIAGLTGSVCTGNQCGGGPSGAPEPGTLFLMGAGLIGLVRTTRRRQVFAA